MNGRSVDPDDLAAFGQALYGEHWQGQLAAALNVGDRTFRGWLSRALQIPEFVEYKLSDLLEDRMRVVGGLVAFCVRLDTRSVFHYLSGASFRIDAGGTVEILQNRAFFEGYDLSYIGAGALAAVQRERNRELRSPVVGKFTMMPV